MIETPTLLITDDDRDFRETLRSAFEPRGFRTHLAADGDEAVRIVKSEQIHVVLMDLHMPRVTGLAALSQVRRFDADLPFILISGSLNDQIITKARAEDVFSILAKPVSFSAVREKVTEALRTAYQWHPNWPPS